jgi:hypothetical protein
MSDSGTLRRMARKVLPAGMRTSTRRDLAAEVDRLRRRLDRQRAAIRRRGRQVDTLRETVRSRGREEKERARWLRMLQLDVERIGSQLGALEVRVADDVAARELLAATSPQDGPVDPAVAQARDLLEAIRREHEQVRVRFGVVAAYEERIRRLEEAQFGSDSVLRAP